MRSREMTRVKRLAKNILDQVRSFFRERSKVYRPLSFRNTIKLALRISILQRTDIERFFLDSLEYVKNEITANR